MIDQPLGESGKFGRIPYPDDFAVLLDGDQTTSVPGDQAPSAELALARKVMLLGLRALSAQAEALTIIGAQAVFELTRANRSIPFTLTTDADTSLAPALVDPSSDIGEAMAGAGFKALADRPGVWTYPGPGGQGRIGFDILVPSSVAGGGRRGARVPGQDRHAVGRADGLELTLIDRYIVRLDAFDGSGHHVDAYVAGPAAITCAKAYKLAERIDYRERGKRDRVLAKDAGDVWRVMVISDPAQVRSVYSRGERDAVIAQVIKRGRSHLVRLFGESGEGTGLAVRDLRAGIPEARVRTVIGDWITEFGATQ